MKLGYIDYLNTYPLYWKMFQDGPPSGVQLVPGEPAALNAMMRKGALDLSPVSAACLPDIQDSVYLLPDVCLAAHGDVRSVLMLSHRPIESLQGCMIGLSTASETSVVLLKYLLEHIYGVKPTYIPCPSAAAATQELDARLVIGNDALVADEGGYPYVYDLGRLWSEKMGLPVVFAVFAVRREVVEKQMDQVRAVRHAFAESLQAARADKDSFFVQAARANPGFDVELSAYFESLKYDFTDRFKSALRIYYDAASDVGLLPKMGEILFV